MKRKTIFWILGGAVVVIAAIIGVVFYATSGVTRTADDFFAKARGGDMAAVYAMTSAELRNTADPAKLASFIKANRFDKVAKTSWSSRSIENNIGTLDGSVTLDDGGVIPLHMQLVSEGGAWKVSLIKLAEAGVSGGADGERGTMPADSEIANLVRSHTGVFLDGVRQNDISYFKQYWVDDVSEAELKNLIAIMRQAPDAADALRDARPVVEQAQPLENGGFQAAGYLETAPYRYDYTYQFVREGKDWKLLSFDYKLRQAPKT
jgi:hypothetical protein